MTKNLFILVLALLLVNIMFMGCFERESVNNHGGDEDSEVFEVDENDEEGLNSSVFRIDFKPDAVDSYVTNQTWDDFFMLNETELKEHQMRTVESPYSEIASYPVDTSEHRSYKLKETRAFNKSINGLLNLTREIDCSNSFKAVKEIWRTVMEYANWVRSNPDLSADSIWLRHWSCFNYQYAMQYALSDAQIRNWDVGNWSEINFYPISNIILGYNGNDSSHASFITSFPAGEGDAVPYVTDPAYCGWKKYENNSEDDALWPWEEYLTDYNNPNLGDISQNIFISPILRLYYVNDFDVSSFPVLIEGMPKEEYQYSEICDIRRQFVPEDFLDFIYLPSDVVNDMRSKILGVYNQVGGDFYNHRLLICLEEGNFTYYLWNR